jgi:hypothetical protein
MILICKCFDSGRLGYKNRGGRLALKGAAPCQRGGHRIGALPWHAQQKPLLRIPSLVSRIPENGL